MKISFKDSIFADKSQHVLLADIVTRITDGSYKDLVETIRSSEDKNYRNDIKRQLPVFLPTVLIKDNQSSLSKSQSVSATGIIQYDIDDYQLERSVQLVGSLRKHSNVLYAFLSPSGGVKFGILTDFQCNEINEIVRKYRIAFDLVQEQLGHLLQGVDGVDGAAGSVSQQCYLSHDSDAYFNASAVALEVNDQVNHSFAKQQETMAPNSYSVGRSISDNEVIRCLGFIPAYLPYADRLNINFALISHFGREAEAILMAHWVGVEDHSKLQRQLQGQIKSYDGRIAIGTLFHIAKQYGYEPFENVETASVDEAPTFHSSHYYSASECTERLETIITDDFFAGRKNKAVIVECGSGKTRTMMKALQEHLLANRHAKVAVFLKTHEMAKQFIEDLEEGYRQHSQSVIEELGPAKAYGKTLGTVHKPLSIKSMADSCLAFDKETVEANGSILCETCFYYSDGGCPYIEQFDDGWPNSNVRVYTHNRLFMRPRKDNHFKPDYLIVDEDMVSQLTATGDTLLRIEQSADPAISGILAEVSKGVSLVEAVEKFTDGLQVSLSATNKLISLTKQQVTELDNQAHKDGAARRKLLLKLERLQKHKQLVSELKHIAVGNKSISKHVWVQEGSQGNSGCSLVFGEMKSVLPEYTDVPMLYMDASGERAVIEAAIGRAFDFEQLRVNQQKNAKVYQFTNRASFSKRSFALQDGHKKIGQICDWMETLDTEKIGLVRYNRINADSEFFNDLDAKVEQINGDGNCIGWFGNVRGINRFEDCDTLLVVGQHRLPNYEVFNLAQLLFREDVYDNYQAQDEMRIADRADVERVYRFKNGNRQQVQQSDYIDRYCALVSNHFDKAETYQALHRLRLIHGEENKTVYLLNDTVLDVSLDGLLDRYKELSVKGVEVLQYLKQHKFLIDSNEAFEEALGWSSQEAKTFRLAREYGDWLKEHRSVQYWVCKTKDRKTIKLFVWSDQGAEEVESWLGSCGIYLKAIVGRSG